MQPRPLLARHGPIAALLGWPACDLGAGGTLKVAGGGGGGAAGQRPVGPLRWPNRRALRWDKPVATKLVVPHFATVSRIMPPKMWDH